MEKSIPQLRRACWLTSGKWITSARDRPHDPLQLPFVTCIGTCHKAPAIFILFIALGSTVMSQQSPVSKQSAKTTFGTVSSSNDKEASTWKTSYHWIKSHGFHANDDPPWMTQRLCKLLVGKNMIRWRHLTFVYVLLIATQTDVIPGVYRFMLQSQLITIFCKSD